MKWTGYGLHAVRIERDGQGAELWIGARGDADYVGAVERRGPAGHTFWSGWDYRDRKHATTFLTERDAIAAMLDAFNATLHHR